MTAPSAECICSYTNLSDHREGKRAMKLAGEARDEIRLSWPIIERLAGQFRLVGSPGPSNDEPTPVDAQATNEHLALSGRRPDEFVTVTPLDPRGIRAERLLT